MILAVVGVSTSSLLTCPELVDFSTKWTIHFVVSSLCATRQDLESEGVTEDRHLATRIPKTPNSLLDLVFGRQAAVTTVEFGTDAVVTLNVS